MGKVGLLFLKKKLKLFGCDYQISKNWFTDFKWGVGSSSAKADGLINHNNEEIILYLRYKFYFNFSN